MGEVLSAKERQELKEQYCGENQRRYADRKSLSALLYLCGGGYLLSLRGILMANENASEVLRLAQNCTDIFIGH